MAIHDDMWGEVKKTVELLSERRMLDPVKKLRLRWLVSLTYVCGLRISEIVCNTMGNFFCARDAYGGEQWWLNVFYGDGHSRIAPVTAELIDELQRYRLAMGLPAHPSNGETTPLILPLGVETRAVKRGQLHNLFKDLFSRTADRLREEGGESAIFATQILKASSHWLRNTAGLRMAKNGVCLDHVRDNLGRTMITSRGRLNTSDDVRHAYTVSNHRIGWPTSLRKSKGTDG